jgi:hypothetical protein
MATQHNAPVSPLGGQPPAEADDAHKYLVATGVGLAVFGLVFGSVLLASLARRADASLPNEPVTAEPTAMTLPLPNGCATGIVAGLCLWLTHSLCARRARSAKTMFDDLTADGCRVAYPDPETERNLREALAWTGRREELQPRLGALILAARHQGVGPAQPVPAELDWVRAAGYGEIELIESNPGVGAEELAIGLGGTDRTATIVVHIGPYGDAWSLIVLDAE